MRQSEARRIPFPPADAWATGGVAAARKAGSVAREQDDGLDAVLPGKALRWPLCLCGSPKCPDYRPPCSGEGEGDVGGDGGTAGRPSARRADDLHSRLAERNRRSSRGGT